MDFNLLPPDSPATPDFEIDSSNGTVTARKGLKKASYLQTVILKAPNYDYGGLVDLVTALISIAEDEMGSFPYGRISYHWNGDWPVIARFQVHEPLMIYDIGPDGQAVQVMNSPRNLLIQYTQNKYHPATKFKVVYQEAETATSNQSNPSPNVQPEPSTGLEQETAQLLSVRFLPGGKTECELIYGNKKIKAVM
jgi:hypothetical protein